jgi:hypothetical protein
MKLIGTVHTFNTKRMYAENGQEIVWAILQIDDYRKVVAFMDRARGIDGVIDIHFGNMGLVDDRWVLRAYDDFHYRHGTYDELELLRAAAKTV